MKNRRLLILIAGLAGGFGLPSLIGAFILDDVTPIFRVHSFLVGGFLVVGAVLLSKGRKAGVWLLWLSACIYFLMMFIPALYRHGSSVFSALMGMFYWSVASRLALAIIAQRILARSKVHG
jgi:hypothetical protein